jgi:hypothetical protein
VNVIEHNRAAWNREALAGSEWSTPLNRHAPLVIATLAHKP